MHEKEELKRELQWVMYRQKMLDIMEERLLEMRGIANQAKEDNLTAEELETLNDRINNLTAQVRALDSESRRTENGEIIE